MYGGLDLAGWALTVSMCDAALGNSAAAVPPEVLLDRELTRTGSSSALSSKLSTRSSVLSTKLSMRNSGLANKLSLRDSATSW